MMMFQPTSGRCGFNYVDSEDNKNEPLIEPITIKPAMLRMLHNTSGRQNFDVVKPDNNKSSKEQASNDQQKTIEQQTNDAIKNATQSQSNVNDKKDSK